MCALLLHGRNEVAGRGELLLNKGSLQLPGDEVAK